MKTSALQILVASMMLIGWGCENRSKPDSVTEENKGTAQVESQYATPQSFLQEPKRPDEITEEEIFEKASTGDEHSTSFLLDKIRLENDPKRLNELEKYIVESAERGNSEAQIEIRSLIKIGKIRLEKPNEIFVKYKQESDKSNLNSMVLMSQLLRTGTGTEANDEQATKLLEKAALEGHLVAQYLYGQAIQKGEGIKKDKSEGAKWIIKSAESGLGEAEASASSIFRIGLGVERNPEKAFLFAKKSHEKNKIDGSLSLSTCYVSGCGVEKNIHQAMKLAEDTLKRGSAKAYTQLAFIYNKQVKWESVFKYAKLGVEAGDENAAGVLGALYSWGSGTKQDTAVGEKLLRNAAKNGCPVANYVIGRNYYDKGDKKTAYEWYLKAGEEKHMEALVFLGRYYTEAINPVKKDTTKAFLLYQEAAELGSTTGKFNLAIAHMAGHGTHKDYRKGVELFVELAKEGAPEGFLGLGMCYHRGEGVVKNEAEALVQYYIANAYGENNSKEMIAYLEGRLTPASVVLCQQKAEQIFLKQKYEKEKELKEDDLEPRKENEAQTRKLPKPAGSGVLISKDGLFVTAYHVIESAKGIAVRTSKGAFNVKILAVDKLNDLALLKVKDPIGEMPAAPLAPSAKMKLGQTVFTLGFPNSDLQGFNVKMTKGEISSTTGIQDDPRQFQISVPLQPGNSGGALFDDQGNIIGIVVAKLSESVAKKYTGNTPENVNYAVKSSYVFPLLEQSKTQLTSPIEGPVPKLEDVVDRIKDACVMVLVEE